MEDIDARAVEGQGIKEIEQTVAGYVERIKDQIQATEDILKDPTRETLIEDPELTQEFDQKDREFIAEATLVVGYFEGKNTEQKVAKKWLARQCREDLCSLREAESRQKKDPSQGNSIWVEYCRKELEVSKTVLSFVKAGRDTPKVLKSELPTI